MKFGSFLLGGLVGAAAVVYWNNKNKSMLLSAFSSNNQSLGGSNRKDRTIDWQSSWSAGDKTEAQASASTGPSQGQQAEHSASSPLDKAEETVANNPGLTSAVNDILDGNGQEKVYQT